MIIWIKFDNLIDIGIITSETIYKNIKLKLINAWYDKYVTHLIMCIDEKSVIYV